MFTDETKANSQTAGLFSPDALDQLTSKITPEEATDDFEPNSTADVPLALADNMNNPLPTGFASKMFSNPLQAITQMKTTLLRMRSEDSPAPETTPVHDGISRLDSLDLICSPRSPRSNPKPADLSAGQKIIAKINSPRALHESVPASRPASRPPMRRTRHKALKKSNTQRETAKPAKHSNHGGIFGRHTENSQDDLTINPSYSAARGKHDVTPRLNKYGNNAVRTADFMHNNLSVRPTHSATHSKRRPRSPEKLKMDVVKKTAKTDDDQLKISPQVQFGKRGRKFTPSSGVETNEKPNQSENEFANPRQRQQARDLLTHAPGIPTSVAGIYEDKLDKAGPVQKTKDTKSKHDRKTKAKSKGKAKAGGKGKGKKANTSQKSKEEHLIIPKVLGSPDDAATTIEPKIGLITFGSKAYTTITVSRGYWCTFT